MLTRHLFINILNKWKNGFNPRSMFDPDDYYEQVKYLDDTKLDQLYKKVLDECSFMPKPSELKKISYEFKDPFVKPKHLEDSTEAIKCECGIPVRNDSADPYRCQKHAEEYQAYVDKNQAILEAGGHVRQVLNERYVRSIKI